MPDLRFSNQQVLFIWLTFPTYGSKKKNNRGPLNWQILLEQTILSLLCLITNINLVHLVMMAYKCSINELHMQTLSTTYNWPSSLKAKPSTSNSKAPLMNLEYQNNNSWNTDTAVLTFLWPVSLMMQINFCHITDLQDNIFFLAWTIWINSYNIYQVFLFHLIFLICSLWNPFELCKENILQKQNKPLCVNLQKYIQRQIRHTDSFVRTKFKENSQGCPGLFLRQTLSCT